MIINRQFFIKKQKLYLWTYDSLVVTCVCVCVLGYVTKWGICPSRLYLNYSISCSRRPDLIEVARGVWSSHTSLGTSGERSISNNLYENIAISATYITSWLLKGLACQYEFPAHSSDQKFVLESISVLLRRLGRSLMRVY